MPLLLRLEEADLKSGQAQLPELLGRPTPQVELPILIDQVHAYEGPYLEGCYQDWASQARELTEMEALSAGRSLLTLYIEREEWSSIMEVAPRVLRWDNCCQVSYLALMQANIPWWGRRNAKTLRRVLQVSPT